MSALASRSSPGWRRASARSRWSACLLFLMACLAACQTDGVPADPEAAVTGFVAGTVTCRPKTILSSAAVLNLQLVERAETELDARIVAEQTTIGPGQPPLRFRLAFPAASIDAGREYTIRARISDAGRLRYLTTAVYRVLTGGHGNMVELTADPAP